MEEKNKLEYDLKKKIDTELNNFKELLKTKTPEEIIENSYKLVCYMGIEEYLSNEKNLSNFELKELLKVPNLLEKCYDDWFSSDGNLREILEYSVDNTIDTIRDNAVKSARKSMVR